MKNRGLVETVLVVVVTVLLVYFIGALALNAVVAFWPLGIVFLALLAIGAIVFVRRGRPLPP